MAVAEVQVGVAKIYGLDGAVITGIASTIETADLDFAFDTEEVKGQNGEVETIIASNARKVVTINFTPNAATRAAAITISTTASIGALAVVELLTFKVVAYNGKYNCMGWTWNGKRDGYFVMTMKLQAPTNAAARAALTAGIITEPDP